MRRSIFSPVDPLRNYRTYLDELDGTALLDELLSNFGWTRKNIGSVYERYILDELKGPSNPKPVIRPSLIDHDTLSETVSLKALLKPRACLPNRAIMFTSNKIDWDGEPHTDKALGDWKKVFQDSVETYPGGCFGKVQFDRWYGITGIDFPDLLLADQLDLPAREYSIPLVVLANPDNIKLADGEFESCRDRAQRINNWIFHKPYVWQ